MIVYRLTVVCKELWRIQGDKRSQCFLQCGYCKRGHPDKINQSQSRTGTIDSNIFYISQWNAEYRTIKLQLVHSWSLCSVTLNRALERWTVFYRALTFRFKNLSSFTCCINECHASERELISKCMKALNAMAVYSGNCVADLNSRKKIKFNHRLFQCFVL